METSKERIGNWFKNSIIARMMVVGFLILMLMIPLSYVQDLIGERADRQSEVVSEINEKWGGEILLEGPLLKIPYRTVHERKVYHQATQLYETLVEESIAYVYQFPDELRIHGQVNVLDEPIKRSIYESVVFTSDFDIEGAFPAMELPNNIDAADVMWDQVQLVVRTSNMKGIKSRMDVQLGTYNLELTPRYSERYLNNLESDHIDMSDLAKDQTLPFSFKMRTNGSQSVQFVPLGKETLVNLKSNWHSPSHIGEYLPEDGSRVVSPDGFEASWKVFQINRQFEQQFVGSIPDLTPFAFGTRLIVPVDEYHKNERTAKYGFMVIGLTLLVFLLIQLSSKIYIHPFQYLMVGLALVIFYTLLLSISEHSNFRFAYLSASLAVLGLIGIYARMILRGFKFSALITASLSSLYGFIYVIIQLENYALLVGSIGLFVILAIIMFASMRIDWNNA